MNEVVIRCSRCIMDTISDPGIRFDTEGVCHYCRGYDELLAKNSIFSANKNLDQLHKIVDTIKEAGKGKPYDCLIGVSGGVDSTYLAYQAKQLGLRPLVLHYDNGWNSSLAVVNIENIVKKLGFDLFTYVNDWDEFRDIQLAFIKASVVDIEMITDHAISAICYKAAAQHDIRYIIAGTNTATEFILPPAWYHWKSDALNIAAIHNRFGKVKRTSFPLLRHFPRMYYKKVKRMEVVSLLDYMEYDKAKAKETIIRELDWKDYGGKHYESIFTRFYQAYILPVKFGIDKRKAHLSSLICSGQMTREEALAALDEPICDPEVLANDKEFVLKKLGLSEAEFNRIMREPARQHTDYPSYLNRHYKMAAIFFATVRPLTRLVKKLRRR